MSDIIGDSISVLRVKVEVENGFDEDFFIIVSLNIPFGETHLNSTLLSHPDAIWVTGIISQFFRNSTIALLHPPSPIFVEKDTLFSGENVFITRNGIAIAERGPDISIFVIFGIFVFRYSTSEYG